VVLCLCLCNALVCLSTIHVDLQVEAWRCSFGYVRFQFRSGYAHVRERHRIAKDVGVFATLSSGCVVDWVHSRSDSDYALLLLCVAFGLWYPGSTPDLLKFAGSKGLVAFVALEFCSLRIGSLGSNGLIMLLYFVSGAVGS